MIKGPVIPALLLMDLRITLKEDNIFKDPFGI